MTRFTLCALLGAAGLVSLAPPAHAQDSTAQAPAVAPFAMKEAPWFAYLRSVAMQNSGDSRRALVFLRAINASGEAECEGGEAAACDQLAKMILDVGGKARRDATDFRGYQSTAADVYQRACDLGSQSSCGEATKLREQLART